MKVPPTEVDPGKRIDMSQTEWIAQIWAAEVK